ncbi:MAG: hypothetical protein EZS28_053670, partial [Streblomastix strix]
YFFRFDFLKQRVRVRYVPFVKLKVLCEQLFRQSLERCSNFGLERGVHLEFGHLRGAFPITFQRPLWQSVWVEPAISDSGRELLVFKFTQLSEVEQLDKTDHAASQTILRKRYELFVCLLTLTAPANGPSPEKS